MRTKWLVKVVLIVILDMVLWAFLPWPTPDLDRPDGDRGRGSSHENICAGLAGSVENIRSADHIDFAEAVVEYPLALAHRNMTNGVEDGKGLVGHRGRPGLCKGGFDRGRRGDICLDIIACACTIPQHLLAAQGRKVNNANALGRLAASEQLQDDITAHEAFDSPEMLACCYSVK